MAAVKNWKANESRTKVARYTKAWNFQTPGIPPRCIFAHYQISSSTGLAALGWMPGENGTPDNRIHQFIPSASPMSDSRWSHYVTFSLPSYPLVYVYLDFYSSASPLWSSCWIVAGSFVPSLWISSCLLQFWKGILHSSTPSSWYNSIITKTLSLSE